MQKIKQITTSSLIESTAWGIGRNSRIKITVNIKHGHLMTPDERQRQRTQIENDIMRMLLERSDAYDINMWRPRP